MVGTDGFELGTDVGPDIEPRCEKGQLATWQRGFVFMFVCPLNLVCT